MRLIAVALITLFASGCNPPETDTVDPENNTYRVTCKRDGIVFFEGVSVGPAYTEDPESNDPTISFVLLDSGELARFKANDCQFDSIMENE